MGNNTKTVRDATYELLRKIGIKTIFGNPGSTEETFLKNFPSDFNYVLGLQEASVIAMAVRGRWAAVSESAAAKREVMP